MNEEKNESEEKESKEAKDSEDIKKKDSEKAKDAENTKEEDAETTTADVCCDSSSSGGNNIFLWLIIIVAIIGAVIFFQQKKNSTDDGSRPVSEKVSKEVSADALKLIKEQLVAPGTKVEIKEVTEESGLYKIKLVVADQEITSYLTKDKMKFIPQLIDIKELEDTKKDDDTKKQVTPVTEVQTKSDKPKVELFVMSYCPYGTQMERGYLPVLKALGNTVDAKLKFVDYAMHGEKEVKENLRQYCIQKNEPTKLSNYLNCFLATTEGSEAEAQKCLAQAQVNQTLLAQCIAATDAKYKVTELAKDKSSYVSGQFPQFNINKEDNEKYGVQGSPTLVINGEVVQSGRDSESILKAICSAFNEQPEACKKELSNTTPAPGFGTGAKTATGASDGAACGA